VAGVGDELYGNPRGVSREIDAVRSIYRAFARRDVEAALEYIADDCELHVPGTALVIGRPLPYRGRDGVRQYFADAERVWALLTIHADDIRATTGGVAVFGHVEGQRGGQTVRRRVLWIWRFRGDKAVSVRANDLGDAEPPA
jgi:ketosteroid isomerase-like protein